MQFIYYLFILNNNLVRWDSKTHLKPSRVLLASSLKSQSQSAPYMALSRFLILKPVLHCHASGKNHFYYRLLSLQLCYSYFKNEGIFFFNPLTGFCRNRETNKMPLFFFLLKWRDPIFITREGSGGGQGEWVGIFFTSWNTHLSSFFFVVDFNWPNFDFFV